jgi:hypothetical protein
LPTLAALAAVPLAAVVAGIGLVEPHRACLAYLSPLAAYSSLASSWEGIGHQLFRFVSKRIKNKKTRVSHFDTQREPKTSSLLMKETTKRKRKKKKKKDQTEKEVGLDV